MVGREGGGSGGGRKYNDNIKRDKMRRVILKVWWIKKMGYFYKCSDELTVIEGGQFDKVPFK